MCVKRIFDNTFINYEGMHINNNKMILIKGSSKSECIKCTIFIENYGEIILFLCENTENLLFKKYQNVREKR